MNIPNKQFWITHREVPFRIFVYVKFKRICNQIIAFSVTLHCSYIRLKCFQRNATQKKIQIFIMNDNETLNDSGKCKQYLHRGALPTTGKRANNSVDWTWTSLQICWMNVHFDFAEFYYYLWMNFVMLVVFILYTCENYSYVAPQKKLNFKC